MALWFFQEACNVGCQDRWAQGLPLVYSCHIASYLSAGRRDGLSKPRSRRPVFSMVAGDGCRVVGRGENPPHQPRRFFFLPLATHHSPPPEPPATRHPTWYDGPCLETGPGRLVMGLARVTERPVFAPTLSGLGRLGRLHIGEVCRSPLVLVVGAVQGNGLAIGRDPLEEGEAGLAGLHLPDDATDLQPGFPQLGLGGAAGGWPRWRWTRRSPGRCRPGPVRQSGCSLDNSF